MLEAAVAAFREVKTAYQVWDAYPNIMYHPALSASQRTELDSQLCRWWKQNWEAHQGSTERRRLAPVPGDSPSRLLKYQARRVLLAC